MNEAERSEYQTDFERDGFVIARGLFSEQECAAYIKHYMDLRHAGSYPGDSIGVDLGDETDPLRQYPRMIHMHRWDEMSLRWLIDPRLGEVMTACLGREPFAVQTMLYFKPAGSRGQGLHQDQFYLKAEPGTCIAAWMALDRCDEENGCLRLVPGLGELPLLCTEQADTQESFTEIAVPLPAGMEAKPAVLNPGDVLFFHGAVIHGSLPNRSTDRFRRSLIGHYVAGEAERVGGFYKPALRFDGTTVEQLEDSPGGGPCGVWVDRDGRVEVEVARD